MKKIVLASGSTRRHNILLDCGIDHTVFPTGIDEIMDETIPVDELVKINAEKKSSKAASVFESSIVIGADTLVYCEKKVIGKPKDPKEAKDILRKLSGNKAEVFTGLCVIDSGSSRKTVDYDKSTLYPLRLKEDELERFFGLLGPYDKAGGFSIEGLGGLVFDEIRGSYFNILGLPLIKLRKMMKDVGVDILDFVGSTGSR